MWLSSGTGDTGDTLLKQTQSPPSAPPSGQEHASCAREDPWPRPRLACWPRAVRPLSRYVAPCALRRAQPARTPYQPSRAPCRPSAPASPTAPLHPCAAFCAASPPTPRNPRQSAGGSNPSPPTHPQRAVAFGERALSLSGRSAPRLRRSARGCAVQGLQRPRGGRRTLSAHCEESHVVVPARNERHNHAAFGGLPASRTKRCEPTRSGALTLFVPLSAESASLNASPLEMGR